MHVFRLNCDFGFVDLSTSPPQITLFRLNVVLECTITIYIFRYIHTIANRFDSITIRRHSRQSH